METLTALGKRAEALAAKLDTSHDAPNRDRANWPEREVEIRRQTLAGICAVERASLQTVLFANVLSFSESGHNPSPGGWLRIAAGWGK